MQLSHFHPGTGRANLPRSHLSHSRRARRRRCQPGSATQRGTLRRENVTPWWDEEGGSTAKLGRTWSSRPAQDVRLTHEQLGTTRGRGKEEEEEQHRHRLSSVTEETKWKSLTVPSSMGSTGPGPRPSQQATFAAVSAAKRRTRCHSGQSRAASVPPARSVPPPGTESR